MLTPRVLPMGQSALLLEVASLDDVLSLHSALARARADGVVDLVPAARTVLVRVDPRRLGLAAARAWALQTAAGAAAGALPSGALVEIDVVYDGVDLEQTAALLGVGADELAHRHSAAQWRVAFTGFAPGFGYLVSDDWPFDVPRLPSPRTRVPAGAVGLAGAFSGAYPRETPGGWRLIGTTAARLFDPDAASPALLAPGTRVRFRPVAAPQTPPAGARADERAERGVATGHGIRIVEPGLLATVQDLGRPGAASVGVAGSGALDRGALRTANRLLGNQEGAAGIEVTMGGLRAVSETDQWVAIAGAWGAVRLGGREVDPYAAHPWPAGAELHVDWFAHGARGYVAVRGGLDARAALGSRSTDLLAGLGPAALRAGDVLGVRDDVAGPIPVAPLGAWGVPHDEDLELELAPGPRAEWFTAAARETLFEAVWTVSGDADRVGARLEGPELTRARTGELASEGMVPGALQVPPSGRPTVLLADGPVTGGYPVIAVLTDASLDLIAQARPGTRIRFRHARPAA
jgi:KipI family sensor histidine kinase inhibitor